MKKQNWIRTLAAGLLVVVMAAAPAAAGDIMPDVASEEVAVEDVLVDDAAAEDVLIFEQDAQNDPVEEPAEETVTDELLSVSEEGVDEVLFEEETETLTEEEFLFFDGAEETSEDMFETEAPPALKFFSMTCVNPLYKDIIDEESLETCTVSNEVMLEALTEAAADEQSVLSTVDSAGRYVRENLKARNEEISFNYRFENGYDQQVIRDIIDVAFAHTGGPTEGDYLKYQYGWYSMGAWGYDDIYTLEFEFSYYTTMPQELQMNSAVASAMARMSLDGKNTYNKILTIHDYICDHVTYDYEHLGNSDYKLQFTAYAALVNGTAVCQGYAVLLYRLMLEAGIDCRVISGDAGGGHAWNIVKLGQYYYYVDATWDDDAYYKEYFLKCGYNDHWVDEYEFPDSFFVEYPIGPTDYDPSVTAEVVTMYRLYNPYTGEHLYTGSLKERYNLVSAGWQYDGEAWRAPVNSSIKVYRLYNPYDDFHFYSANESEIQNLMSYGWIREGVAWCSDEAQGTPIYRLFNPYETTNYHMFTISTAERDLLVSVGWRFEGVAFYGVK